ncbi:MAG: CARDB domain-containing protein, partial [Candidatus Hydrothermarchaeaceae archaeon]
MKKILILILLLIPAASAVGADFYVIDITPTEVTPGETTNLNITLKNLGSDFGVYLRAILDPDDTSPIDALDSSKKYLSRAEAAEESREYFGVVQQLESIPVQYRIKVDDNATTGAYNVPLNLIWDDKNRVRQTQTVYLGIAVVGKPHLIISGINTTPQRIYSDTEFTLDVNIENTGTAKAKSVEAALTLPDGITGEDLAYLGTIKRDRTAKAGYTLKVAKTAKSGAYEFALSIRYTDEEGTSGKAEMPFKVFVSERGDIDLEIAGISTSPAKIYPGTDFT